MKNLFVLLIMTLVSFIACSSTNQKMTDKVEKTGNRMVETVQNDGLTVQEQWEIDHPQLLKYIESNDLEAQWLNSGLYYVINKAGRGETPTIDSKVKVNYSLSFLDGTAVWENEDGPEEYFLRNVIAGWTQGLPLIQEGGSIKLIVPSGLAYGPNGGWNEKIPPNANLVFDIELLAVN